MADKAYMGGSELTEYNVVCSAATVGKMEKGISFPGVGGGRRMD